MGTKRNKKSKQELEMYLEEKNTKGEPISEMDLNVDMEHKKNSKKKKHEGDVEDNPSKRLKKLRDGHETETKKKKRKKNIDNTEQHQQPPPPPPIDIHNNDPQDKPLEDADPSRKCEDIDWPAEDLTLLLNRMEELIPEKDTLLFTTRVDKLDWSKIAFNDYSIDECKRIWNLISKKLRRFRLLREVLVDAKDFVTQPKVLQKPIGRVKKHPDMPSRPPTPYLMFYLKKKDKIMSENPGLVGGDITKFIGQIYKNLPPEKKEKYEKLAASNKEEYLEQLKVFFEKHPELSPPSKTVTTEVETIANVEKPDKEKTVRMEKVEKKEKVRIQTPTRTSKPAVKTVDKERPPKKNQTSFNLYFHSELKNNPGVEKGAVFKDKCKEQWKQLSDKKKLIWITMAEEDSARYQSEVSEYKVAHPEYGANKMKPAITKSEKNLKERLSGKPVRPPNSAYGLYSKIMLQSEEIKIIHPKERMNFIASKWKNVTEEEMIKYRDEAANLNEKYKIEFKAYLESLPEDQRTLKTQAARVKRKPTKARIGKSKVSDTDPAPKFKEPEQPPISPCKYFATVFTGTADPTQVWKSLNAEEKRKYEGELTKKKQAYIVEFEKFLKSLTKEELEAFCKSRQKQAKTDDEDSSCSSETDEDGDDEGDDNDASESD